MDAVAANAAASASEAVGIERLIDLIGSGAVHALRASYVCELAKKGKPLAHKEALPEQAFWTAEQLSLLLRSLRGPFDEVESERRMAHLFVGVSWRWLTSSHPDPDGVQIAALAALAAPYLGINPNAPLGHAPSAAAAAAPSPLGSFTRGASSALVGGGHTATSWREATVRTEVFEPLGLEVSTDFALLVDFAAFPQPEGSGAPQGQSRRALGAESQEALSIGCRIQTSRCGC